MFASPTTRLFAQAICHAAGAGEVESLSGQRGFLPADSESRWDARKARLPVGEATGAASNVGLMTHSGPESYWFRRGCSSRRLSEALSGVPKNVCQIARIGVAAALIRLDSLTGNRGQDATTDEITRPRRRWRQRFHTFGEGYVPFGTTSKATESACRAVRGRSTSDATVVKNSGANASLTSTLSQ